MTAFSRRSFLGGVIALAAYSTAPKIVRAMDAPRIWADGLHDDAPGLNALFAGEPVDIEAVRGVVDARGIVSNGIFLIRSPLKMAGDNLAISTCRFTAPEDFQGDHAVSFSGRNCLVERCLFDLKAAQFDKSVFVLSGTIIDPDENFVHWMSHEY